MPANWTTPRTWNIGEIVTAGQMNTQVRDNLDFLKARSETPMNYVSKVFAQQFATTSTQYVDLAPGYYSILNTSGAPVLITISGAWKNPVVGAECCFDFMIDSQRIGDAIYGTFFMQSWGDRYQSFSWSTIRPLAAGAHAFMPQWRASTGTLSTLLTTSFYVLELV